MHELRSRVGIRGAEEKRRNKTRDECKLVGVARRLNVQVALAKLAARQSRDGYIHLPFVVFCCSPACRPTMTSVKPFRSVQNVPSPA